MVLQAQFTRNKPETRNRLGEFRHHAKQAAEPFSHHNTPPAPWRQAAVAEILSRVPYNGGWSR
jgi:hypothetical protein